ncbi:MAG: acetate/propionate family kinase [Flexilinea sp.]|nr:acetate/propionate family kinase [Flexilinea sp.]
MNILVFNCGSSSTGFTVFHETGNGEPEIPAYGKARNVATKTKAEPALAWTIGGIPGKKVCDLSSHRRAAEEILTLLREHDIPIDAIAHRFVNGGERFQQSTLLDDAALAQLRECLPLAPIHNPNSYSVIEVCRERLPEVPQYAVFDTAFHAQMSKDFTTYAIPREDAKANGWRKVGFHGLSYQYVSHRAAELLGKPYEHMKLVMCHLGTGGSSVCAFRDGHSVDTSMGYSPTAGLVMSTRSGDLDPEIVLELMRKGMSTEDISEYLNKKSGLLGLSGYSSNLGEIIEAAKGGNKDCELAFNVYVNRLRAYIGSFLFLLNGADALVFTDDAGVKFAKMREAVCRDTDFFGLKLDPVKNAAYDMNSEACISTAESRVQIWVIPTDEERTIYNEIRNKK